VTRFNFSKKGYHGRTPLHYAIKLAMKKMNDPDEDGAVDSRGPRNFYEAFYFMVSNGLSDLLIRDEDQ